MTLPYSSATSGDKALAEIGRILERFGASSFGTMQDMERGMTIVQFQWRCRQVSMEASWKGYAAAWLKENRATGRSRMSLQEREKRAVAVARVAVCSVLRDWVKGQITAVECGILSFEAVFFSQMLLPNGERVLDRAASAGLLPAPEGEP